MRLELSFRLQNAIQNYKNVTFLTQRKAAKSCTKYKTMKCDYSFRKYFNDPTFISCLLSDDASLSEKSMLFKQREQTLYKVKNYNDSI